MEGGIGLAGVDEPRVIEQPGRRIHQVLTELQHLVRGVIEVRAIARQVPHLREERNAHAAIARSSASAHISGGATATRGSSDGRMP